VLLVYSSFAKKDSADFCLKAKNKGNVKEAS